MAQESTAGLMGRLLQGAQPHSKLGDNQVKPDAARSCSFPEIDRKDLRNLQCPAAFLRGRRYNLLMS